MALVKLNFVCGISQSYFLLVWYMLPLVKDRHGSLNKSMLYYPIPYTYKSLQYINFNDVTFQYFHHILSITNP